MTYIEVKDRRATELHEDSLAAHVQDEKYCEAQQRAGALSERPGSEHQRLCSVKKPA